MTADAPTILATSGGIVPGSRTRYEVGPLTHRAVELADVDGVARSLYVRQDSVARNPYGTPSSSIAAARTAHAAGAAAVATAAISFSA